MVAGSGEQSLGGFKRSAGRAGSAAHSQHLMVQAPGRGRSAVPARLHPPWPSLCFRKAEPAGDGGPFLSHPRRRPAGSFSTVAERVVP